MYSSTHRLFELKAALFFLLLLLLVLGTYSNRKIRENRTLKQEVQLLEADVEKTRQQNLLRLDSLQGLIQLREEAHRHLKDSLLLLERERTLNTRRSNEKKAAISRIADVDSLYGEVARHYP